MKNPRFYFKQFSLLQDQAAMKVTTDACVFGAWSAMHAGGATHFLDIGTGTGLLTLMLAQHKKNDPSARFTAIELDAASHRQTAENFSSSPWAGKIALYHADARTFVFPEPVDFVIVNPPFYENQLPSPSVAVSRARHDSGLLLSELPAILTKVLTPAGRFSILLPVEREHYFRELALKEGFSIAARCQLRATPSHSPFRSLLLFKYSVRPLEDYQAPTTEIIIRDTEGKETPELLRLMTDYYIR